MFIAPAVGIIIDIIVALILIFSFIGGFRAGAIKEFFALLSLIIALPVAGIFYGYVSSWLHFIPDTNWQFFLGFLLTLCIIIIILHLLFMLPSNLIDRVWHGGFIWSLVGGLFNLINSAIGLVVLVTLIEAYPVFDWLNEAFLSSNILNWLVSHLGSVLQLLPESIRYSLNVF